MAQWKMSDEFWANVEPLIPQSPVKRARRQNYQRRPGAGRKPLDTRLTLEAILYALRTGCQWKALPEEFGSASSIHKYFLRWLEAGLFTELWRSGLAEWNEMEGVPWAWQRQGVNGKRTRMWGPVVRSRNHSHFSHEKKTPRTGSGLRARRGPRHMPKVSRIAGFVSRSI